MSKAFAARSPSDYRSWWTATAIASAIELGSLRLFVFLVEGDDHGFLFLACFCALSEKRIAMLMLIFASCVCIIIWGPNLKTEGRKAVQIACGSCVDPAWILWGSGGDPGTFCVDTGF